MSQTIERSFVQQFGTTVLMLAEQQMSRIRGAVRTETVRGEAWTVERLAGAPYQEITNRFAAMPLNEIEHTRRWGYIKAYDSVALLDSYDKVRNLVSFESPYTRRLAATIGRAIDTTIINALDAPVQEGKTGATTVNFPTAQRIFSVNSSNVAVPLDMYNLLRAKERLLASEAQENADDPVIVLLNANAWRSLLEDNRITSADYNTLRALETGSVQNLMGMQFIRTELIPDITDTSYDSGAPANRVFMFRNDAIEFGVAQEPTVDISRRNDLRTIPWQAYIMGAWGAVRTEDVRVVRIHAKKLA
jgi:hypothetical protein